MNGDGAFGFTQIGVLHWLEDHHIPIGVIAGTSVGGWVGGAYATGMSPAEILGFVKRIDFTMMIFFGDAPYQAKGNWAKVETVKLPGAPELQLGPLMPARTPDLIVPLLPGVAKAYRTLKSFDDLPTAFRCEALDLAQRRILSLDRGSLPDALKACITMVGVSNPVRLDGRILVSGSIVNGVPADGARAAGADVIIASYARMAVVGNYLGYQPQPVSALQQIIETLNIARLANEERGLRLADVVIPLENNQVTFGDLNRIDWVEQIGYNAAKAKTATLLRFAVPDKEWNEYLRHRSDKRLR
jgi:NTE family protein